jgi:adenylate kinase family enzyme
MDLILKKKSEIQRPQLVEKIKLKNGIICDGSDQSGKTTLCERLSKELEIPAIHFKEDTGKVNGQFDYLRGYIADLYFLKTGAIFDRNYTSELVYGSLLRECKIDTETQKKIEAMFSALGYFVVFLERKNAIWQEREEYVTKDQNELVKQKYRDVFETISLEKMFIDPTNEDDVQKVIEKWKKNSYRSLDHSSQLA